MKKDNRLLLNCQDIERTIIDKLRKLKKFTLYPNKFNKRDIKIIAKKIADIHSYKINHESLKMYSVQWVITQISNIKNKEYKNDIITALKIMSQIEYYKSESELRNNKFLVWDINNKGWQEFFDKGHIGSYIWDIAAIISYMNNSLFSDVFLENYIKCSKQKISVASLYANIYYIQVVEAAILGEFKNIIKSTKEIIESGIFDTNLISYSTFIKLQITGY